MAVERDGELNQEVVLDVAVRLLATVPIDDLTLTRLAEELGVTQPALYRHVGGIDDLWRHLGLRGRAKLAATLTEATIGRSGTDSVIAAARAWRSFTLAEPGLYAATDRYPCAGDVELEAAVERVVEVLAMSLRGFDLDEGSTIDAARTLRSSLHGFVHLEMGEGHPHPQDNDASFETMVSMLCIGFEHLAGAPH